MQGEANPRREEALDSSESCIGQGISAEKIGSWVKGWHEEETKPS